MRLLVRATAAVLVIVALAGDVPPASRVGAAVRQETEALDLADLPLRPDELPERGYQIMTGGYLDRDATAGWLAEPRRMDRGDVERALDSTGWEQAYALDLVLLEDRAFADSGVLALVQTTLYAFSDAEGASDAYDAMADFGENPDAELVDDRPVDGSTVHLMTESGDTLRTMVRVDRIVVEVVSLESFRPADAGVHDAVVIATIDRVSQRQDVGAGLAERAVRIEGGEAVADLVNAPDTGVHQLYRVRDDVVQPAAGEVETPEVVDIAPDLARLYVGSQGVRIDDGVAFASTWIGEFVDEAAAVAFLANLPETSSGTVLADPYFQAFADEEAIGQGVPGVYRVSGATGTERFSGTLEIRQRGPYVVGVGWRVLGSVLPSVDVTSRLMDAQLGCLQAAGRCLPVAVDALLETGSATPVAAVPEDLVRSEEFGWSMPVDPAVWTISEQYVEPGYDFTELQSGRSLVTLESVIDQRGNPEQCVLDELDRLRALEERAAIDLGSDVAGEAPAGMEPGHAWAIYTVEPLAEERADQEYTIRIDCYTLVAGGASLVMTQTAPHDLWADERVKGNHLREGIVIPSGQSESRALDDERLVYTWRHMGTMIKNPWIPLAA